MPVEVAPSSLADLRRLGEAYKAGDKALQKRIRTSLQDAAKPLSADVIRKGSEKMPGGLAARVAAARGGVTVSLSGSRVSVSIRAKTREGYALRKFNEGQVRHKVFGRWVPGIPTQQIPANAFTDAFDADAAKVRDELAAGVQKALEDIAREA